MRVRLGGRVARIGGYQNDIEMISLDGNGGGGTGCGVGIGWGGLVRVGLVGLAVGLVGGFAVGRPASAQEARIAMTVDTTLIHVGDPVTVRLAVDHPEGWTVEWPDSFAVAPFEVLSAEFSPPVTVTDGGGLRSTATLVVTSFELGDLEIPSIAVPVTAPDGTVQTIVTNSFRIGVETIGLDESGDLRDIKGPLSLPRTWWRVLPWVLLALALAGGVAYYLHRRGRAAPASAPPVPRAPPRPYHELALEALRALEKSSLLERGQIKEYHVQISEIVRRYIEGQLEVPALELTTQEVAGGMQRAALGDRVTGAFRTFLERCDLVKFAKLRPGSDEARALMAQARELVRMTSGAGRAAGAAGGGSKDAGNGAESVSGGGAPAKMGKATAAATEAAP